MMSGLRLEEHRFKVVFLDFLGKTWYDIPVRLLKGNTTGE